MLVSGGLYPPSSPVRAFTQVWPFNGEPVRRPAPLQTRGAQGDSAQRDKEGAQDKRGRGETEQGRDGPEVPEPRRHHSQKLELEVGGAEV